MAASPAKANPIAVAGGAVAATEVSTTRYRRGRGGAMLPSVCIAGVVAASIGGRRVPGRRQGRSARLTSLIVSVLPRSSHRSPASSMLRSPMGPLAAMRGEPAAPKMGYGGPS